MDNINYDAIIVGSGFSGAVCARQLAEQNKKVLILEKNSHVGGASYDCFNKHGILIHPYGPHIFHTDDEEVFNWISKFTNLNSYQHKVVANIPFKKDRLIFPIPFNFTSLELTCNNSDLLKKKLLNEFNQSKVSIFNLQESKDKDIAQLGQYIFETVFYHYTKKQWGTIDIDKSVLNRVPISLSYNETYFQNLYQGLPENGYGELFKKILSHKNITLRLNFNALNVLTFKDNQIYFQNKPFLGKIIYTGEIDKLFNCCYGKLPYRSISFQFETLNKDKYQENYATVNYPLDKHYTRITEFKNLTGQEISGKTTILKEYPIAQIDGFEPLYPILNNFNKSLYYKYKDLANNFNNLFLLGRLAEYKYFNMDEVIHNALLLSKTLK